ncbi:hypothetical protein KC887_07835 [Candidatus Kaiserbacteria bacterium]|nr:hypothetical protein [Candidatus Kaiserbacteria bacterium]
MKFPFALINLDIYTRWQDLGWSEKDLLTYVVLLTPRMEGEKKSDYHARLASYLGIKQSTLQSRAEKMVSSGLLDENWQPVNDTDWDALSARAKQAQEERAEKRQAQAEQPWSHWYKWFTSGDECVVTHPVPFVHYDKLREKHATTVYAEMKRLQLTDDDLIAFIKFAESRYDARNDAPDVRSHLYSASTSLGWWCEQGKPATYTSFRESKSKASVASLVGDFEANNPDFTG